MAAVRIVAPSLWGWVADRRGRPEIVVRHAAAASALIFALVFLDSGYWWLAGVTVAYQLFWSGVLPQFEAVTLAHLARDARPAPGAARGEALGTSRYPRVRLWGSIGFVATALAVGELLERHPSVVAPLVVWVLIVACAAWALTLPATPAPARSGRAGSLAALSARPDAIVFLAACALMQASHGPYYVFYSIHLKALGYTEGTIGALWALGVVAEIVLFAVMPRLFRAPASTLLVAAFALTALRWAAIAWLSGSLAALALAQLLHAVSFGLHHAVAISLVHRLFPARLQGRGQALYAGIGYGVGGVLGGLGAGYAWTALGARGSWLAASALAACGVLVSLWLRGRWGGEPTPIEQSPDAQAPEEQERAP